MASQLAACSDGKSCPLSICWWLGEGRGTAWVISPTSCNHTSLETLKAALPVEVENAQMLSQLLTEVQKPDPQPVLQPESQQSSETDLKAPNIQQSTP